MKKIIVALILLAGSLTIKAQTYGCLGPEHRHHPNVETCEIESEKGIVVQSTTVNSDKSITATFFNRNNKDYTIDHKTVKYTYTFKWYLSYKGKRVSDYYIEYIPCQQTASRTVYIWPDEVPRGNEKYVTVQLGLEPDREAIHVEVEHK